MGEADLQAQLSAERRIAELSRSFLSAEIAGIDDAIRRGLGVVAEVGGADRSLLVSLPELRRDQPFFFEWSSDPRSPSATAPSEAEALQYGGFSSRLLAGEVVSIPSVADMPDDQAKERRAMRAAGIRSYLLVPAISRGTLMGILCLHCTREERDWSENQIMLLQLVADLFTSVLRRKRNEIALSQSEARFRALAENSQDPICELTAQAQILYASPAFAQLVGSERKDLEGSSLFDLAEREDRKLLEDLTQSALAGIEGRAVVFRARDGNGDRLDLEVTAQGFSSALGEMRLVAVVRDVSQRERDRRGLEQQVAGEQQIAELSRFFLDLDPGSTEDATREKLAVAAELAGADRAWMFTLDPRGLETHRRYDWTREGIESGETALPESGYALSWAIAGLTSGRELNVPCTADLPSEAAREREDLLRRGVRSTLVVPLSSGGESAGLMGFELTTQERSWSNEEVTLLRLVGEVFVSALRREQSEVELERSQNQLLQAQKMEAVGTLAGGIAHDFNNHLAVMLGNARFVSDRVQSGGDTADALADLQRSAEHCAQLTRSLLAFSRRSPVTIQAIAVSEVLSAAADLIRPLLPRSIQFEMERYEGGDTGDAVRADPTQLRQVLVNLIVNARDAMPDGGVLRLASRDLDVSTQDAWSQGLPGAGRYVELSVGDNGCGMSDETRDRIFEPFFTTKRLGEGTGLGLATAYGIIQQCRGAIAVDSEIGVGSTFRVLLPLSKEAVGVLEPAALTGGVSGSETLLVVEDEPAVRRLVSRTLRQRGYRVLEAEDGIAGMELAYEASQAGDDIDLLITDLVMPRLGGAELASKLQVTQPDLRVLFLSGHAEPQDASPEAKITGARCLPKPFDEDALLREVRLLVER